jgi:hypothetical protein
MKAEGRKDAVGRNISIQREPKEMHFVALISYCTLCTLDYHMFKGALRPPQYIYSSMDKHFRFHPT